MDKFWSIFAMPIGLFICFTPIVLAWLSMAGKKDDSDEPRKRK